MGTKTSPISQTGTVEKLHKDEGWVRPCEGKPGKTKGGERGNDGVREFRIG